MSLTHTFPDTVPVMTLDEWRAECTRRYGADVRHWRLKCPICGGTQSIADFEALPEDRRPKEIREVFFYSCIGRWLDAPEAFAKRSKKKPPPTPETHCNYTLGGLFCLAQRLVISSEGEKVPVFDFAEVPNG